MSPYALDVILWYYCRCEDHPDYTRQPPVWSDVIDMFIQNNMLTGGSDEMTYQITDRGKAFCEALQRVPLPVQIWVIPQPEKVGADGPIAWERR
jgi:hypothetical protein